MHHITSRLFDDTGRHLDRFGLLFVLSILSVTLNSLVDLDDPTATFGTEIAWIVTTIIVAVTLRVAMASSGVAPRPLKYATIAVALVVVATVLVATFAAFEGSEGARPNAVWVFLAAVTPAFVTRRLFLQERVTASTIFGALAAFLLAALAFNYAFLSLDQWVGPIFGNAEPTTSFMYFSLVTITTLGYGDLTPVTDASRYFATVEAVLGTIFLVTVVARLVAMFGREPKLFAQNPAPQKSEPSSPPENLDSGTT